MSPNPSRPRSRSLVASTLALAAFAAPWAAACGSRGPLDDAPPPAPEAIVDEAGLLDASVSVDATDEPIVDAGQKDTSPPVQRDAGPLECGLCVAQQCSPAIVACIQNPSCTAVFQCVIQTCLLGFGDGGGGGGLDASCLIQCGAGNIGGALQALQIFQCITQTCGPECSSVLGGLLGGGFPGGGGGFPFPGGGGMQERAHELETFEAVLSPWPQLFTRSP